MIYFFNDNGLYNGYGFINAIHLILISYNHIVDDCVRWSEHNA